MRVPRVEWQNRGRRRWLGWTAALAFLLAPNCLLAERQPEPSVKLALDKLGFPGFSAGFLNAGASMLTVNLLDDTHLLVTFGLRGLVPRLEGDPQTDEDHVVGAEIVDIPSGKIEAKTQWHLHDHARYLWPLGRGRFLVRIGNSLGTIAPLANLASGDAFLRVVFPYRGLYPSAVFVSPDTAMVTIEAERAVVKTGPTVATWGDAEKQQFETFVDLFRIKGDGTPESPIAITAAKAMRSPRPLLLPINVDGYLWETQDQRDANQWSLSFDGFGGKTLDLGPSRSSCEPRVQLLSSSQFLLVSCRGTDDQLKLAAYGFDGHENWEEPFGDFSTPAFAFAPEAGRFAFLRTMPATQEVNGVGGQTERQELRVYQTESGDLLLKVPCTPILKTGENFDLSADGRVAVVVRDGAIWVYPLAALTARDRKDLAEVQKYAPPAAGDAPVNLARITVPASKPGEVLAGAAPQVAAPVQTPAGGISTPSVAQAEQQPAGDGDSVGPRKPPTLLNPGEKPEFKDKTGTKSAPPQ
jgi:hypothetical protein